MAAAQFSDDAYNKDMGERGGGAGTLIGNWFEERSLRDACGEGRTVPQRHLPRSGLLKDWTKVPSGGPRKQDNTFERTYGPKADNRHVPMSKMIGAGEADVFGDKPIAETLQAAGRIPRVGQKELLSETCRHDAAEAATREEEEVINEQANERSFGTTTGTYFQRPDMSKTELPQHWRKSFKDEILHGPPAERKRALLNEGMDVPSHVHYSNMEAVTQARASMGDPRLRSDIKVSASSGVNTFGRHGEFSKPVGDCLLGLSKDDELETMYQGLHRTNPLRTLGGSEPRGPSFQGVPSLAALKETIHRKIAMAWGQAGYVVLRQRLFDLSDDAGFVKKSDVMDVMRQHLSLSLEEVSEKALNVYIEQQITMKKDEVHVGALMSSLRPALAQKVKRRVIEAFEKMEPVDASIRLGTWLDKIQDQGLQDTIITAFGAQGAPEMASNMPITESVFLELHSDLAPLMDINDLLV
eukprot:TRINITY_DN43611_c0_g1_i1.p1 TRINITY_DN43611_c0_g1~~TRINITY_DN43611_c0_g1_i1.p1  ORF type:complete len:496 (-),score=96.35 TRINITY_DN43611_c0_g1_i1:536-1942(-)